MKGFQASKYQKALIYEQKFKVMIADDKLYLNCKKKECKGNKINRVFKKSSFTIVLIVQ